MGLIRQSFVTPLKDFLFKSTYSRHFLWINMVLVGIGLSSFHLAKDKTVNHPTAPIKMESTLACAPVDLAYWSMEACESYVNDPTTYDYSEFTAIYPSFGDCSSVTATNIYRNEGTHSCTDGAAGSDPIGMCVDIAGVNAWSDNDNKAIRFEITLNPSDVGRLTGLSFYEKAPSVIQIFNGNQRDNNYPTKYGIRVSKNGTEIFQEIAFNTSQGWTLESFDFSNDPDFTIYTTTTFQFELLAYDAVSNGGIVTVWDVDNFSIQGSCGACPEICDNSIDDDGDGLFDGNDPDCCDNLTNGGQIGSDQTICGANPDPLAFTELTAASGGSGNIVYMWLSSTTACPDNFNQAIAGATSATYNPGPLSQTTWFVRCARREGCTNGSYSESNCIKIEVDPNCGTPAFENWEYSCDDGVGVEIIGEGIQCQDSKTINIPNPGNVTQIIAEVVYKGHTVTPGFYTFNTDVESVTIEGQKTTPSGGYFYRTMLQATGTVSIDIPSANKCKAQSILLYVFRNDANGGASAGQFVESWIYHNTVCRTLTIPTGSAPRDLEITVPLSELTNDNRIVNVIATAGGVSNSITVNSSNLEDALNITPFTLSNVPAGANTIEVCVESPTGNPDGQSLVFSGAIKVAPTCLTCDDSDLNGTANVISNYNNQDISCTNANDGRVEMQVNGGLPPYAFVWSNGATTAIVNDLSPGNYTVTVTDDYDCSITSNVSLSEPSPLTCEANVSSNYNEGVQISSLGGNDGTALVVANGGVENYTYQWNDGATQTTAEATNLSSGTYEVQVSDANGCTCNTTVTLLDPAKIGDFIFEDENGNGVQDAGELGIANITVVLSGTAEDGTPVSRTVTTGLNGEYYFDGLPKGTYKISLNTLGNYQITYPNETGTEATDSDVDPSNAMSNTVTVDNGEYYPNLDAGLYLPAKLGNYTWNDQNGNGLQDAGEASIGFVSITLSGTTGNGTSVSSQTITSDANGFYQFDNLIPGTYQLNFVKPDGFDISDADQEDNDLMDSDVDPITGMTSAEVLESDENNETYDAGFYQLSSIGDFVWEDLNANGIQDAGEPGIVNVSVTLSGTSGTGTNITLNTTTDTNGFYNFPNLTPGSYQLIFETPNGYQPSYSIEGTNPKFDSDADPVTGMTAFETLEGGEINETYDAGFYQAAFIGNFVWEDLNGNGVQDTDEPGIADVEILLTGFTGNGTPVSLSQMSKPNGKYGFTDLVPGTYQLTFVLPNGYEVTYPNLGTGGKDSDIDPTTGATPEETLVSGETNESYDAGYYRPAKIGNFVWEDTNGNGLQDADESGLNGIEVTLTGTDGAGFAVTQVLTTQGNGNYIFPDLRPGTYKLTIGTLPNYSFTDQDNGFDDNKDSDVDVANGMTIFEVLISGETNTSFDAGLFAPGSIGNFTWKDCDKDGIQSEGEEGLGFVPINLSGTTGNGTPINMDITSDANGFYEFINLKPGTYILTFGFPDTPTGLDFSPQDQGGNEALDSDVNTNGQTVVITLGSAVENQDIDAGFMDVTAPQINPQADELIVECDGSGNQSAFNDWLNGRAGAAATDNCTATENIIWTNDFTTLNNDCGATGTVSVTFTATDECGNSSNTTASFTITDNTDPILLGVPSNTTIECDDIPAPAAPTASDNCSSEVDIAFNEIQSNETCTNTYILTRTWIATDECGNQDIQTQIITVEDTTDPVLLGVPTNTTASCDDIPAAAEPTATDNCDNEVTIAFAESRIDGNCTYTYTLLRTWTATDACGNQDIQTQTITVEDDTEPILIGVPSDETVQCDEIPSVPQIGSGISATDNCDPNVNIVFNEIQTNGGCPNAYTLTRMWTATDVCGNQDIQTQVITVEDTTDPILTGVPSDETVECDAIPAPAEPTVADNCDTNIDILFNEVQSNETCTNSYILTRTWTATDDCGNQAIQTQVITVEDTTDPILTGVPADETVQCDAIPAPAEPTVTDNCDSNVSLVFNETQIAGNCANNYTLIRTWTATDICGNETIETQEITVEDTTDPTLLDIPSNITLQCDGVPAAAQPTATDNCDTDVTIVLQEIYSDSTCFHSYTLTRIWTATDNCGNQDIQTQVITVVDTTLPIVVGVPSDETVECDAIPEPATVVVSDNCDTDVSLDFTEVQSNTICPNSYTLTRTWIATDACGNENIQTQIITVEDTTDPTLLDIPSNTTVACDEVPTAAEPTATDNCDTDVDITFSETTAPGACANSFILTRTWTATDACGNQDIQTQTITVEDTTEPILLGVPTDETVECDAIPAPAEPTATDNCDSDVSIAFNETQSNVICANSYTLVRTWTATDACGNQTIQTQNITVEDTTDPILTGVPSDETVQCDAIPAPAEPTVTDNCDINVSIGFNETTANQGCSDSYTLIRTWTATDACGNQTIETQNIIVEDTTDPILTGVPLDETVECNAIPTPVEPVATDNCTADVTIVFNEVQSNTLCANSYTLTRTWTATDACGNQDIQTQIITVEDTTDPILTGVPSDETVECDAIPNPVEPTATDNCTTNVVIEFSEVQSNALCVNSYTLTRTWTATDVCGNQTIQTQVITVEDTTDPILTGIPSDETVECDAIPSPVEPTATDNCDTNIDISFSEVQSNGACANVYTLTRTWTATDACGNQDIQTQVITVEDNTDPILLGVPSNETVSCTTIPAPAEPTATDNCDTNIDITFNEIQSAGNCPHTYTLTRTWTATDACGNQGVATQIISVEDNESPTLIGVPANTTAECQNIPSVAEPTATDDCDSDVQVSLSEVQEAGNCSDTYLLIRTWTATDACGNQTVETQTITVEDVTDPILTGVPADETVECDAIPNPVEPTATDNCDSDVTVSFNEVKIAGNCTHQYVLVRTWTATDDCGNVSQQTQNITVEDTTDPILTGVPTNTTAECDNVPAPPGVDELIATDNCDINVAISFSEIVSPGDCTNAYEIVRIWTATDACGNQDEQSQVITVLDSTSPILIGVPADASASCGAIPPVPVIGLDILATDNCDVNVNITFNEIQSPGNCGESYVLTRTWTATDNCGNQDIQTQVVTIGDDAPPAISGVPANTTVECNAIPSPAEPTAIDDCATVVDLVFDEEIIAGNCPGNYQLVRTWTATDDCDNESVATQVITVEDTTDPILLGVPANISVNCNEVPPPPSNDIIATDNCDTNVSISFNEQSDTGDCVGSLEIIRTWTATDHCGNTTALSQVITVTDEAAPTLTGVPDDLSVECDNIPAPANPQATDDCDDQVDISFEEILNPINCSDNYILTRTWTATDNCGKETTATQTITVEDTTDPILLNVPSSITVDLNNGGVIPPVANVLATDNCDTDVTIGFNEVETTNGCGLVIVRTWTATDNCGNTVSEDQTITVSDSFTATISPEDPEICAGTFVQFEASPSSSDFTYEWSATGGNFDNPNAANSTYTMMTPGTYTISLTISGIGCSSTATTTVTVTADGTGTAGVNSGICEGNDILLTASGGLIYFWTGPNNFTSNQQNPMIPNASIADSGTYTVNIGGGNCSGIVDVEVVVSEGLVGDFNKTNVSCDHLGMINVGIFGGLGIYTYDWLDLPGTDNGEDRTDLSPGIYSVIVTDAGGCTFSIENIQILNECGCEANAGGLFATNSGLCLINNQANLSATPNGNAIVPTGYAVVYLLSVGNDLLILHMEDTPVFDVDLVGEYTIHTFIYDPNTFDIEDIDLGLTTGGELNALLQQGGGDICAALDVMGASVSVTFAEATVNMVTPEICDGANGTALLLPSTYTYNWDDGGVGASRNDLSAGTYEVVAVDQNGCEDNLTVTIGSICECIPPVVNNIVIVETNCGQALGSASIVVAGNPTNFTYSWFPNTGNPNAVGNSRTNLLAGVYSVTITNPLIEDCFIVEAFAIGNIDGPEPTSIVTSPASCGLADGTATLLPEAYNYVWLFDNLASGSRSDLAAGTYEVIVVNPDAPDCPNIATVVIAEVNTLFAEADVNIHPICQQANGEVTINITGGSGNYLYQWNDGSNLTTATRDNLSSGSYTITIEDQQSSCETVLNFVLTDDVIGANIIVLPSEILLSCSGDANGEVDYTFALLPGFVEPATIEIRDGSGNTVPNGSLTAGQYCIVIFDGNDCLAAESCFSVTEPEAIQIEVELSNQTCDIGGSIALSPSGGNGGFTFDWDDLNGPFNPQNRNDLMVGTYTVTVTDFSGCTTVINDLAIVDICNPPIECETPQVENVLTIEASCGSASGSATIMMVGDEAAFSYQWTPNVSTTYMANNLPSGVYTVLITRTNDPDCFTSTTFVIGNIDGPQAEIVSATPATCTQLNGTAVLSPVNFIYEWCNGLIGFNVVNLPAGSCFVTVTNPATGCTNIVEVVIDEVNTLALEAEVVNLPDCGASNGEVMINVTGGSTSYTYLWSDQGSSTANRDDLASGIYMVTVIDNGATGCSSTITFTLMDDIDAGASVNLANDTIFVSCVGLADATVDFDIIPEPGFVAPASSVITDVQGNTYLNGELPAGNYCILVTDANDCLAGQNCFAVLEPSLLNLDISLFNQTCDTTGMIQVVASGGNGGYTFDWADLNGPFNPQNRVGLGVGAYSLTVTDFNGCTVAANNLPIIDECSGCPSIDTVQLAMPINSQGIYCFELEACFDSTGITYGLYDGNILGSSSFGNWTLGADGCLTYNANDTPGVGVDTICIVANDNGLLDTTCVVVTITTDCAIFGTDTIQLQTFECDLGGSFCLPIGLTQINNYSILDNGQLYNGGFEGCETDTTITYYLQGLINDDPVGPYELVSWNVENETFSIDTFLNLVDLVDSMNLWDPMGDWELLPNNTIVSGNILSNYGPLNIRSYTTFGSTISGVIFNINSDGTLITLDTGFHQIIISELASGCVDTLNIGLECINCPIIYDGPMVLDAPNCNELLPVCLSLPIEDIVNLSVTDNGQPYTAGLTGCDLDSIYSYVALTFLDPGNYVLENWEVNGMTFSTVNFSTAAELVDSMNVWDASASWILDGARIEGGDFSSAYGDLVVSQNGINIANSILTVNLFPNGIAISLDTGFHQVIVTNTLEGCIDTIDLLINCNECLEDFYTGPDSLDAADCDSLTSICVGLDPERLIDYTITDNGVFYTNGFNGCDFDSIYTYVAVAFSPPGNYTLNSWQVNSVFFSMGNFVSIQELVDSMNVWDPNGEWGITGTSIEGGDFTNEYGALTVSQFGLELSSSDPTLNLTPTGMELTLDTGYHELIIIDSIAGCIDTFAISIFCDDFSVLPTDTIPLEILLGFTDTICMDTTVLPGIIDTIYNICEMESGNFVEFGIIEDTYCIEYTGFDLGTDPACIVICDDQGHCDTTVVLVTVVPPSIDSILQEITFGEVETYCIDTTELPGMIDTIYNICDELSGENIAFTLNSDDFCVDFEGVGLGSDQACIVICDEFGYCDTTYLFVNNLMGLGVGPVAVNNDSATVINTPIVIDVLGNDTINGTFIGIDILEDPHFGVAVLNTDYTFTYAPFRDTCEVLDSFTYVLMTSTGNDTATVFIEVLCDELTIFSGFSPNGDNVNDIFAIRGIERFPNNTVLVFNRWGNQVYRAEGYTNAQGWDGTWEGDHLPDGTYFYVIDDGEGNRYSGYVQIHR